MRKSHARFCSRGEAGDRLTYCTWPALSFSRIYLICMGFSPKKQTARRKSAVCFLDLIVSNNLCMVMLKLPKFASDSLIVKDGLIDRNGAPATFCFTRRRVVLNINIYIATPIIIISIYSFSSPPITKRSFCISLYICFIVLIVITAGYSDFLDFI